jgi:hypothetical protein
MQVSKIAVSGACLDLDGGRPLLYSIFTFFECIEYPILNQHHPSQLKTVKHKLFACEAISVDDELFLEQHEKCKYPKLRSDLRALTSMEVVHSFTAFSPSSNVLNIRF